MNDHDREIDPSKLRLEKEELNKPAPAVEVDVEIDESDITMIDDQSEKGNGAIEPAGLSMEENPSVIDMAGDDRNGQTPEIEIEAEAIPPESEPEDSPVTIDSPEVATDGGPSVLDLASSLPGENDEFGFMGDTPALDRKARQLKQGISSEKPKKEGFSTRKFKAGDVIFKEGDPGNEAYLILNGQVKITRQYKKKSMKINQLGNDQIFGEMAIITGEPRTATAKAVEPTDVFIITEKKLNEKLSQNLAIVKNLIDQLIDRIKQLLEQQSTMISKVERSLLLDKKLEVIKAQVKSYEKKKPSGEMDAKLKALFESILKL